MLTKQEQLGEMRNAFARRYRNGGDHHMPHEFEMELDRLTYAAFAAAQEPFVRELEMHRDLAMKTAFLSPSTKAL